MIEIAELKDEEGALEVATVEQIGRGLAAMLDAEVR